MNAQIELLEGTNRDTSKSQYFSPPKLAQRVVQWALSEQYALDRDPMRVLEPSAGNGALVRPLVAAGAIVDAIEIDARYRDTLCDLLPPPHHRVWAGDDFLQHDPAWADAYDLCVTNPPYHDDGESKFVLHALKFAPRVVGIFRADVFYSVSRGEGLWKHVRPTRVAWCSRRPWKGAETDYCVLELVTREHGCVFPRGPFSRSGCVTSATLEWWSDAW